MKRTLKRLFHRPPVQPGIQRPVRAMLESLEQRRLFAVSFPAGTGLEFQTNGQERTPDIGDWYTTATSSSTDRAHYLLIEVTQEMLTAGGGTVAITVNDAESTAGAGAIDEVSNAQDPTRFRLLGADRSTVLSSTTVPGGSPNATPINFSVTTPGTYFVQSVTGAGPISGDNTPGLNDDDNAYSLTVSQPGGLLGQYQATFQPTAAGNRDLFFVVGSGTTSLFLRNFDLDGATVLYTRPDGTTLAGTSSANGLWNGPSPTLDTGGDTITGLTTADAGTWKVTLTGLAVGNQTIFEPNDGVGRRIVVLDTAPQAAGNFTLGSSGALTTTAGVAVDHPFTLANAFATSDTINLTTTGTAAGFTAQLLDSAGVPLTDSTGDGVVDTGVLQTGESKNFILRVTPSVGTTGSDTTTIQAVSFLDTQNDSANNTTRSIARTTSVVTAPVISHAVVDYGFLRSRDATMTGQLAAGDPGPHRVRINWGDGKISFIDLADGQTNFMLEHRYTHEARRPPVTLTATNTLSGLVSNKVTALSRSQERVIQTYRDVLGRDPTSRELRRYSKRFDHCRSADSLAAQAASLRQRLANSL